MWKLALGINGQPVPLWKLVVVVSIALMVG